MATSSIKANIKIANKLTGRSLTDALESSKEHIETYDKVEYTKIEKQNIKEFFAKNR